MAYKHKLLSEIKFDTPEHRKEASNDLASNLDLQDFMKCIRKAFRGIMFTPHNEDKRKVYVHMPNEPYVMGWIAYGDYQTEVRAEQSSYIVSSKYILNMKYAEHNDQYSMAMSINLDTAVRNAKKYFRPVSTRDMALHKEEDMRRKANDTESRASNTRSNALSDLLAKSNRTLNIEYNPMLEYMRTLVKVGHEFTDKELESNLLNYFKLEQEHEALKSKGVKVSYVRIYEKYGEQFFDVVPITKDPKVYGSTIETVVSYKHADVPQDVLGKVAVLSMVENNHWVDDVGYRVDAKMFYVTAKSNE